jgi:hypothetical protein
VNSLGVPSRLGISVRLVNTVAKLSNVRVAPLRRSMKSALENGQSFTLRARSSPEATTSRSASKLRKLPQEHGIGHAKIAVLAPTARASVTTAVRVKTGCYGACGWHTRDLEKTSSHLRHLHTRQSIAFYYSCVKPIPFIPPRQAPNFAVEVQFGMIFEQRPDDILVFLLLQRTSCIDQFAARG